jgi:DEAD/DEAH box helicase domain-containing protein
VLAHRRGPGQVKLAHHDQHDRVAATILVHPESHVFHRTEHAARTWQRMAAIDSLTIAGRLLDLADGDRLVHAERIPARPPRCAEPAQPVDPALLDAFGVDRLWVHQARAIDLARAGTSLVVATGTASGKSLCFQLPIAEAVGDRPPGTALLVYPTKALAQDQLRSLTDAAVPGLVAATYDGDTGTEARGWVRRNANVVLTNPEMLHAALLPYHARWATFLHRLRFIVVDELHVLRGIFGTHVAHVLRRLRRVAAAYGASPTFVFSSATIGEPAALASSLCGLPVTPITDDGAPRGERLVALWNPPLIDRDSGLRVSSNVEVARVMTSLVSAGHRTVAFCRSRRSTESVAADVRRRLDASSDGGLRLADTIRSYRAGYLAAERRAIEADLYSGAARGVVATSALELGVDIGGLDACVLNGFPGTIASMWQQIGRAGRGSEPSVAVLVAGTDQLDQWLMAHPHEVFNRPPEPAVVNLDNLYVAEPHLACAAFEAPLSTADERWWGERVHDGVRELVLADRLRLRDGQAYWSGRGTPAPGIGLRTSTSNEFRIVDTDDRVVGTVDSGRAFDTVHPGAIYLHVGQQYKVERLDLEDQVAHVTSNDSDTYTQARRTLDIAVRTVDSSSAVGRAVLTLGTVEVTSQVTGFDTIDRITRRTIDREPLELPPSQLMTRAFWYTVDEPVLMNAKIEPASVPGTLHAVEHAAIGILPLFAICDRWDVGGVSIAYHTDTRKPTIFIYDGYPGGAGVAELGFAAGRRHLEATLAVVERCRCRTGCPSCVQSPKCGNGNELLDKAGAVALLRAILTR